MILSGAGIRTAMAESKDFKVYNKIKSRVQNKTMKILWM